MWVEVELLLLVLVVSFYDEVRFRERERGLRRRQQQQRRRQDGKTLAATQRLSFQPSITRMFLTLTNTIPASRNARYPLSSQSRETRIAGCTSGR